MYKELFQAASGKIYGNVLCRICKADQYIFFPESESAYLESGMELLPQYIRKNRLDRVVIIYSDRIVKEYGLKNNNMKIHFKKVSKWYMDCLLKYYALENMSGKWLVVSTKQPYDTGAEHLLGVKGVTYKDIIYYDIYRLDGE